MHIDDKILYVETSKPLPVLKWLALRHALVIFPPIQLLGNYCVDSVQTDSPPEK
jgi:hypothetical protein